MKKIFASLLLAVGTATAADKPNILWLIAEDFGPQLGCYGTKEVTTPNLDALAKAGVRFTHAYNGNVCSPSRSAFMTGMYSTTIGAHNHRSHRNDNHPLPDGVRVLTDWLRDAGYFTANIVELPADLGFKGSGKTDWNFTYTNKPFDSKSWSDLKTHQPFYAQINFKETHRDFKGAKKADPAKVEIPPYYPDHPITRQDMAAYLDDASELDRKCGLILQQLEKDGLADNTIIIFFGDNGAAHVRAKQFCYEEGHHVPLLIRWPKNFPVPKNFKPGTVDARFIEGIDLSATTLDIAGVKKPAKMQGRVILGDRTEPDRDFVVGSRDRCDMTAMRIRTVRDSRWRYIRNFTPEIPFLALNEYKEKQYPVWNLLKELHAQNKLTPAQSFLCQTRMPDEELYDLETDPHQINNLAKSDNPDAQAALKRLRSVLEKWIEDTNDQGRIPEPAETINAEKTKRGGQGGGAQKKKAAR